MKEKLKKIIIGELAFCARFLYRKFRPFVIGITGSTGKTTTKYMTGELFKSVSDDCLVSSENLNSEFGLPLAMLGYAKSPQGILGWIEVFLSSPFRAILTFKYKKYLILEYASDKPGDMEHLISLVPPDITVITNIGVAHLQAFKTVDAIAKEKWNLAIAASDKVICDAKVAGTGEKISPVKADVLVTGKANTAKASEVRSCKNKTEFNLQIMGQTYKNLETSFVGLHNIENLLLAVTAVVAVTGESAKVVRKIEKILPMEGRGKRSVTRKGTMIIDESYNANPASMVAAFGNLKQIGFGRKVAILGEMKELGEISSKAHSEVAKLAKTIADFTVGVGGGFRESNLDKWYANVEQLAKELDELINKGDTVLVKGSHSVGLEKIVSRLKENS